MAEETIGDTCPTCGEGGFKNAYGVRSHHVQAHGESIQPRVECEVCGDEFQVNPSRVDDAQYCSYECSHQGRAIDRITVKCEYCGDKFEAKETRENPRFCSRPCQAKWQSEHAWEGNDNPRWSGGTVTVTCDWCSKDYDVVPARKETTRFCSMECKGAYRSDEVTGEKNPRWKGGKATVQCERCGDEYTVDPAKADETRFCSRECYHEHLSTLTGQDNPNWRGGKSFYFSIRSQLSRESWEEIRGRALDNECTLCNWSEKLEVHHIIPLKAGGTNEEWNLMTLCVKCHGVVEGVTKKIVNYVLLPEKQSLPHNSGG